MLPLFLRVSFLRDPASGVLYFPQAQEGSPAGCTRLTGVWRHAPPGGGWRKARVRRVRTMSPPLARGKGPQEPEKSGVESGWHGGVGSRNYSRSWAKSHRDVWVTTVHPSSKKTLDVTP